MEKSIPSVDSFPMIVRCWAGQMDKSDEPGVCKRCSEPSRIGYRYCALCCLQEDMGLWKRDTWKGEVVIWD